MQGAAGRRGIIPLLAGRAVMFTSLQVLDMPDNVFQGV